MPIRAVTLDCAQTIIEVHWQPAAFALAGARAAGLALPPEAEELYKTLHQTRLPEFLEANRAGDRARAARWYAQIYRDWLVCLGQDPLRAEDIVANCDRLAFGPDSILFKPFPETLTTLQTLRARGYRLAVLSNWDYTLERVLDTFGFTPFLEFSLASLEFGVEKPEPAFFAHALHRLGLPPSEVLHIGDNPIDDLDGARQSGLAACLIDRTQSPCLPNRINSLSQFQEVIDCLT